MDKEKFALITGASGGIGQALCSTFLENGYKVIALDRLQKEIDADFFIEADLDRLCVDHQYRTEIITKITDCLPVLNGLAVLINNAAIQIVKPMAELSIADWHQTLNVNLLAPFLLSQGLFSHLEKAEGSVVNIASIHARLTKSNFTCYATSKSALIGLTKSMAVEVGSRVRVNAICPAAIATPMLMAGFDGREDDYRLLSSIHPVGRIGQALEAAEAALFLASDKARFINGACLELDGGIGSRLHDPA